MDEARRRLNLWRGRKAPERECDVIRVERQALECELDGMLSERDNGRTKQVRESMELCIRQSLQEFFDGESLGFFWGKGYDCEHG